MRRCVKVLAPAAMLLVLVGTARAQDSPGPPGQLGLPSLRARPVQRLSSRAILSHKTVKPGGSFRLAVEMSVARDMVLYGPAPGGADVKPQPLKVRAGETDLLVGETLFAPTKQHVTDYPDGKTDLHHVYEGTGYVFLAVTVPAGAQPGRHEIPVQIEGQVCEVSGLCVSVRQSVLAEVEVGGETARSADWTEELEQIFSRSRTTEQWAAELTSPAQQPRRPTGRAVSLTVAAGLGLALLAGLILNIMPCVLPVIPLRLLALLEQAKQSRRRFVTLGLAFAAGIVLFFVAIAALNIVLKLALAYTLKWGDLFRHPEFIVAMVLFLVALAANMFGAFTVTVPGRLAAAQAGRGHLGAVGMGFLMAILSTPCSFAILAAAFGWAQAQELWLGTVGILLIGVGMAAPHAVLAGFPQVVSKIPPAGRWSELFKQSVGFVLLLIAVWLLGTQMADAYPAWVMGYAVVLGMCLWVWGSWVRYDSPAARKWAVRGAAVVVAAAAGWWMLTPPGQLAVKMRPFDAAEIAQAHREGKTVLVKFTASWCLECKVVDLRVYGDPEVAEQLKTRGVAVFKGDVTTRQMPASEMLYNQLGQAGPPVTAILPPGGADPILLRGSFSKAELLKALAAPAGKT